MPTEMFEIVSEFEVEREERNKLHQELYLTVSFDLTQIGQQILSKRNTCTNFHLQTKKQLLEEIVYRTEDC